MNPTMPTTPVGPVPATQPPPLPQTVPRQGGGFLSRLSVVVCFGVLGWLMARQGGLEPVALGGLVFLALAAGVIGRSLYTWALVIFNAVLRREHGAAVLRRAVDAGFLMLIPFTVLAVLAELRLDWNVMQAFASAGIMLGGAMVGAELGKLGQQNWFAALVPSLGAGVLAAVWLVLLSLAQIILPTLMQ